MIVLGVVRTVEWTQGVEIEETILFVLLIVLTVVWVSASLLIVLLVIAQTIVLAIVGSVVRAVNVPILSNRMRFCL